MNGGRSAMSAVGNTSDHTHAMVRPSSLCRSRAGFTFVELAVVTIILLVALLIFSSTMGGISRQRATNRESALAMEAARNLLETMRGDDFTQVFALYNATPADDPDGAGTAPGHRFAVTDLRATTDSPDGLQGEVFFPTFEDPVLGLQLREDIENQALGLPRDLSGDSIIDDQDHSANYFILPVRVVVRWTGKTGTREYRLFSQICRFNKA